MTNNCKDFEICGIDSHIVRVELTRDPIWHYGTELPAMPGLKNFLIRSFGTDEGDRIELQMEFENAEAARRALPVLEVY